MGGAALSARTVLPSRPEREQGGFGVDRNELFRNTGLSKKDQDKLMHIAESIGLYAEVTGCDLFIDCICSDKSGRVIAHGRPKE